MQDMTEQDDEAYNYQNDKDIKKMNAYSQQQADEDLELYLEWQREQGLNKE